MTGITNLAVSIVTLVSTNTYHPKQVKVTHCYPTNPPQYEDAWVDCPLGRNGDTRDNPDVEITEFRRKVVARFEWEGRVVSNVCSDELIGRTRKKRVLSEKWVDDTERDGSAFAIEGKDINVRPPEDWPQNR